MVKSVYKIYLEELKGQINKGKGKKAYSTVRCIKK